MDISTCIGFTCNTAADRITDTIDECTILLSQLNSSQGISSFTTLGNSNHDIILRNYRIAITELRSIFHFYRNTAVILNHLLADKSGMPRGSTSNNDETFGIEKLLTVIGDRTQHHTHFSLSIRGSFIIVCHHTGFNRTTYDTSTHTITQAFRLFEDFLQHKVRETTLLYLTEVDIHSLNLRIELYILDINHLKFFSEAHYSDVTIFQINHLVGIFNNRTGIRTQIKLSILSDTYNQWTLFTGSNDLIRVTLIKNCDSVSSDYLPESHLNGSQQIKVFLNLNIFNQLDKNLCICLASELYSLGNEILLDIGIVFNDSIMNHGKVLASRIMRVSIHS